MYRWRVKCALGKVGRPFLGDCADVTCRCVFFFFCRPLLPLACQSVRMKFLAVSPGVHTIAALTLMDVELGYSINLRWVWFFLLG